MKYVSLHNHSTFSFFDALGHPKDHYDFVLKNAGEDGMAHAITDHGNANGFGYMASAKNDFKKKGIPFKIVYGVEFYYHPSLTQWRKDKELIDTGAVEEDLVVEDQTESRGKTFNPINKTHHLVINAYNQEGLKNLYRLVSRSYRDGFYRKPRIDFEMLAQCKEGLIASTACVAGIPSYLSIKHTATNDVFQAYDKELKPLMDLFGKDHFYLELQFNALPEQTLVNKNLMEYSKTTGFNLIVTSDAHYYNPQVWRDREIYRLLGRQQKGYEIPEAEFKQVLEGGIDQLKCELYPHNGDQIFAMYKKYFAKDCADEKLIQEAIERTWHIAHELIEEISPDSTINLPKFSGIGTPFNALKELCIKGLTEKKLADKPEYITRLANELKVVRDKEFAPYFLTLIEALDELRKHMLTGPGRGCFLPGTRIKMSDGLYAFIETINKNDKVLDAHGEPQIIIQTFEYDVEEEIVELEFEDKIIIQCTKDHKFLTKNRGWIEAKNLNEDDDVQTI